MKKILHLLFIPVALIVTESSAQLVSYFNVQWTEKLQHSLDDFYSNEARKVVVNESTGDFYVLADFTSNVDFSGNISSSTFSYTYLIQYDQSGVAIDAVGIDVGQHEVSGFDHKSGFGLEIDDAGNLYIGYMSYTSGTEYDVNIAKFSNSLVPLWTNKYNPVSNDLGLSLKVTSSGIAYAAVKSVSNGTTIRHRIIKASASGTSTTSFYNFNSAPDYLSSLTVDASDNVYVTGYRLLLGVKSILTASVSPTGTLRWINIDNCGTANGNDAGNNITVGIDGFVYVTGSSVGTVQHGNDVVTTKLAATNGKKAWQNFINQTLTEGGVFVDASSPNVVYVGWVANHTVYLDQIVSATGISGRRGSYNPVPESPYTGLTTASISDFHKSNNGNYYMTGNITATNGAQSFSSSYLIRFNFATRGATRVVCESHVLGSHSQSFSSVAIALNNTSGSVIWLQNENENATNHQQEKIDIQTLDGPGTFRANSNTTPNNLTTFPSPASERVFISSENLISDILIYNVSGQLLLEKHYTQIEKNQIELDIINFSPGLYLMQVNYTDGTLDTTKLLVE